LGVVKLAVVVGRGVKTIVANYRFTRIPKLSVGSAYVVAKSKALPCRKQELSF
jgi:hypothetical protein